MITINAGEPNWYYDMIIEQLVLVHYKNQEQLFRASIVGY